MSIPREVVLVKLGGSLITDKRRDAHPREQEIRRLAGEVASVLPSVGAGVILGHGSGSFGHVAARQHGFAGRSLGEQPVLAAAAVRCAAATLHQIVTGALVDAGVPAWSWAPSNVLHAFRGRPATADARPLLAALSAGFVPVTYGDVVLDRQWRASICSTESVLVYLVRRLLRQGVVVGRVLWLGDTAGVYDADGHTVPRVDAGNLAEVRRAVGGSAGTDVTGGMLLRLETAWALARLGVGSWIVDGRQPGLLAAGLRGETLPGTHVVGP